MEPNNSRETATLTRSMVLRGELSDRDAEDWFELGGQEGTMPGFTISHGQDANFDFEVFSSNVLMCSAIGEGPDGHRSLFGPRAMFCPGLADPGCGGLHHHRYALRGQLILITEQMPPTSSEAELLL